MDDTRQPLRHLHMRAMLAFVYGVYIYVATYAIMMNPHASVVVDPTSGNITRYTSYYMFAPMILAPHPPTVSFPATTWANTVFYPIDVVRDAFCSRHTRDVAPKFKEHDNAVQE
jgi:hypothetical protein